MTQHKLELRDAPEAIWDVGSWLAADSPTNAESTKCYRNRHRELFTVSQYGLLSIFIHLYIYIYKLYLIIEKTISYKRPIPSVKKAINHLQS